MAAIFPKLLADDNVRLDMSLRTALAWDRTEDAPLAVMPLGIGGACNAYSGAEVDMLAMNSPKKAPNPNPRTPLVSRWKGQDSRRASMFAGVALEAM